METLPIVTVSLCATLAVATTLSKSLPDLTGQVVRSETGARAQHNVLEMVAQGNVDIPGLLTASIVTEDARGNHIEHGIEIDNAVIDSGVQIASARELQGLHGDRINRAWTDAW